MLLSTYHQLRHVDISGAARTAKALSACARPLAQRQSSCAAKEGNPASCRCARPWPDDTAFTKRPWGAGGIEIDQVRWLRQAVWWRHAKDTADRKTGACDTLTGQRRRKMIEHLSVHRRSLPRTAPYKPAFGPVTALDTILLEARVAGPPPLGEATTWPDLSARRPWARGL